MAVLKKRSLVIIATIILVLAIVLSSFFYLNSQKAYSGTTEQIILAVPPHEINSLIFVAENQQYFATNGLNVTMKNYALGQTAVNAVLRGEADIALAAEYNVVQKALANESIVTFGSVSKNANLYLIARTDKGINSIADLKGKAIGVPLGSLPQFTLGRFLELNGLNITQVTLVNTLPAETANAMANGTIDAGIIAQPNIGLVEDMFKDKTIKWPAQAYQPYYVDAICTSNFAKTNPELIIRFLKTIVQAEKYVANNQDKAISIVAAKLNYTNAYLSSVWSDLQLSVSLDQSQILAMQDEARWAISNHLTNATAVPSFLNYIYVDGLKSVKPAAVNIIG
jgi:ABC-type nitrate/sulfonate/bicarbonate transport system substrate-binding protein